MFIVRKKPTETIFAIHHHITTLIVEFRIHAIAIKVAVTQKQEKQKKKKTDLGLPIDTEEGGIPSRLRENTQVFPYLHCRKAERGEEVGGRMYVTGQRKGRRVMKEDSTTP